MADKSTRAHWSNRLSFILAAAGSAVGLGNIWKFPYMAGENGGGAFVLLYLLCIAVVGIPIFIAELYIGQQAQKNAVESFEAVDKKRSSWRSVGFLGLLSAFLILSFYSVVGGWVLDFGFRSLMGHFKGLPDEEIKAAMGSLFANPWRQLFWHSMFMAMVMGIVMGGVKSGLERWNNILMPGMLGILCFLLLYSVFQPGFVPSLEFLFAPKFEALSPDAVLEAIGHAFFTLSLGMGAMITYGSYLKKRESLVKTALAVGFMDTAIAIIAGVVIFTAVFTHNSEPGAGPALMFQTLPVLFQKMPLGDFVGIVFFLLVTFAALTSGVSLLEVVVAYYVETKKKDRVSVTLVAGSVTYLLGILAALSFNELSSTKIAGHTFFDLFDGLTSKYFLPIGGLLISLFFGWKLGPKAVESVVGRQKDRQLLSLGLLWLTRVVAPLCVLAMLIYKIA